MNSIFPELCPLAAGFHWLVPWVERVARARIGTMLTGDSFKAIPRAAGVLGVVLLHVAAIGHLTRCALRLRPTSWAAAVGVTGVLGFAGFGFEVWALGHLRLLTPTVFLVSGCGALLALACAPGARAGIAGAATAARRAARRHPVYAASVAVVLGGAFVSGLRPPVPEFDDSYHWPSAEHWSRAHGWVRSPHRLTNGPAMAEMLFTVSAAFGSPTAGHWTATAATVVLVACAAAIAGRAGVPTAPAAAAVLSIPVLGNHASLMLNDATAAMFVVGAFAVLWCTAPGSTTTADRRRRWVAAGLLLAAAMSCKFLMLVAAPAIGWLVAAEARRAAGASPRRQAMAAVGWCMLPVAVAAVLWTLHTHHLIGQWRDASGQYLARSRDDAFWQTGAAAGRVPTLADVARLPVDLVQTTVWGQSEPYGGRTGLLWLAFLPLALTRLRSSSAASRSELAEPTTVARTLLAQVLVASLGNFFLLGPLALKTRFHLPAFILLTVAASLGYDAHRRRPGPAGAVVRTVFLLLVWIGMLDGARKLLLGIVFEPPPA